VALVCDTGPLYAAIDEADRDHAACVELLTSTPEPLVVPSPVIVELDWLVSSRLGSAVFQPFLADIEAGAIRVVDLTHGDYARVHELCARYADLPLGFVDAAVLTVVERLREPKLATLDQRHFRVVQPRHTHSLLLVPDDRPT
jgi:uncharacterized protein